MSNHRSASRRGRFVWLAGAALAAVLAMAAIAVAEKPITVKAGNLVLTDQRRRHAEGALEDDDGTDHPQRLGQDRHRRRHPPAGDQAKS